MTYEKLLQEANSVKQKLDELKTAVYVIVPFAEDGCLDQFGSPRFFFVSYFDIEEMQMRFTITDKSMSEIRLLAEIPSDVMLGYCLFVERIRKWQEDRSTDFPYHANAGKLPEEYAVELRRKLEEELEHNGDEAKLE